MTSLNQIIEIAIKLEGAGNTLSDVEKKRAFLRGLCRDLDIAAETIVDGGHSFHEAVLKLTVRELRWSDIRTEFEKSFFVQIPFNRCFAFGQLGNFGKECQKNGKESDGDQGRKCFV